MEFDYINDKSWMYVTIKDRMNSHFLKERDAFIKFAFNHVEEGITQIACACNKCQNKRYFSREDVAHHILLNGFVRNYEIWRFHGESYNARGREEISEIVYAGGDMENLVDDAIGDAIPSNEAGPSEGAQSCEHSQKADNYEKYMRNAKVPIYPNANYSTLSWFVKLFQIKCLNNRSNKSF